MTTNTTNSQAASIAQDVNFHALVMACAEAEARLAATAKTHHMYATFEEASVARKALIAYVEAKREEARLDGYNKGASDVMVRAIAAESRLAEIQRGVEGLSRYGFDGTFGGDFGWWPDGHYISRTEVLALLQPQGQADTSGLPG